MATEVSNFEGLFKERYADKVEDLNPEFKLLQDKIAFRRAVREGKKFIAPVTVRRSHGVTFNGTSGTVVTLNAAVSAQHKDAEVSGVEFILKESIAHTVLAKAEENIGNGDAAFVQAFNHVTMNVDASSKFYLEAELLYGGGAGSDYSQVGIGTVSSAPATGATTQTITLTQASWADGIWANMEGGYVDVYNGATKINSNADIQVTGSDADNFTVTLTGNSTDLDAIDATHVFLFRGAYQQEIAGLVRHASNVGSLHSIDASTYAQWGGNTVAAGSAALTSALLIENIAKPVARGGLMKPACAVIAARQYGNLINDFAALRRYTERNTQGAATLSQGAGGLKIETQNGYTDILSHGMAKLGEAILFPPDDCMRVGASDVTFSLPGVKQLLTLDPSSNAFVLNSFWHQGLVCVAPRRMLHITGLAV